MKTSMKNKVMIGQMLKEVVAHNMEQMEKVNGDQSQAQNLITIEIDGQEIFNPFESECGRYEIEPVGYYGRANMEELTAKYYAFKKGAK